MCKFGASQVNGQRRQWHPTPVFLPGESQGRRSLVGCRLWGHTESDTTEATQQQQQQGYGGIHSFMYLLHKYFLKPPNKALNYSNFSGYSNKQSRQDSYSGGASSLMREKKRQMIDIQIEHTRSTSNERYVKTPHSDKLEQLGREPSRRNTEPKL